MSKFSTESLDRGVAVVLTGATLPKGWRSQEMTWVTAHGPGQSVAWDGNRFVRVLVGHAAVAKKMAAMLRCQGMCNVAKLESLVLWDVELVHPTQRRVFDVWASPVCDGGLAHV